MGETSVNSVNWQRAPRNEAFRAVFQTAEYIKDQQRMQRLNMAIHLSLYAGGNVTGLGRDLSNIDSYYSGTAPGLRGARFNMCAAVVDTAHSRIAGTPPVPIYVTSGTDLSIVRKADRRSKVLQSQMNELGMSVSREAFHMACKVGTGIVHGYLDEDGLPQLEHVNPLEILVEHQSGYYRQPTGMHRVKYVAKDRLSAMYPSMKGFIEKANGPKLSDFATQFLLTGIRDQTSVVEVIESWYLGVGKSRRGNAKPGRHSVSISNCDLLDDQNWEETEFPFSVVRYRNRAFGFFGAGLVESVREAQNRVNHLIKRVAKGQDLGSNLIIFNPNGEGSIDPQWISNEIGLIFNYEHANGTPTLAKWDGTMADLQQQIDLEFARVLKVEGLAESQVNGEGAGKGLSSGVAVRAQDDVMAQRLINPIQLFNDFNVGIARLIERLNDRAADEDDGYVAKGFLADAGRTFLRSSRWKDLDIPEGEAVINLMTMGIMPTTPAGRWASVSEWLQAGFVDRTSAMKLLQFPALDEWSALQTAQADLCRWQIEKILDLQPGDPPVLPMERQDLKMCEETVTMAWAQAQMMRPSDEVQIGFDSYLGYIAQLQDEAAANQNNAAVAGGVAAPMGGISAAPVAAVPQAA